MEPSLSYTPDTDLRGAMSRPWWRTSAKPEVLLGQLAVHSASQVHRSMLPCSRTSYTICRRRKSSACLRLMMAGLSSIYLGLHVLRRRTLESNLQPAVWTMLMVMLLWCMVQTVGTHPGAVPASLKLDEDGTIPFYEWLTCPVRVCKHCKAVMPDRCHHCKKCQSCILKMDHHCPWLNCCIGFNNYKLFLLLSIYADILCQYMFWSMATKTLGCMGSCEPLWRKVIIFVWQVLLMLLSIRLSLDVGETWHDDNRIPRKQAPQIRIITAAKLCRIPRS
ncbi:PFA3 [Symbiodinium sp. CCMP2592]|nr:PFA3 [Symbiodinium sp. CCMP2592]